MDLDLFLLGTWQRFESFCFHLARAEEGYAVRLGLGPDGGRDIVVYTAARAVNDISHKALQCKFTRDLGSNTKRSIEESLTSMGKLPVQPSEWILCLPVDPSGPFLTWLEAQMEDRGLPWQVWGRSQLLAKLREAPDVLQQFFYPVYADLRELFVTESMKLVRMELDPLSQWTQPDPKVLTFCSTGNVLSPDLVFDVTVQNRGDLEAALFALTAHVGRCRPIPHGFPGDALLHPQITYRVPINGGEPGDYEVACEPPLLVKPRSHERFKVALSQTGYSWGGTVQLRMRFGESELCLPAVQLMT